jgi:isopenicillin N synthase-like dioxygenase
VPPELICEQWPDEKDTPGFRHAFDIYLAAVGKLGEVMNILVAEALGLEPMALMRFFGSPPRNKVSLLKYPEPSLSASSPTSEDYHSASEPFGAPKPVRYSIPAGEVENDEEFQGVGPHKDGGFLTYLLQATAHDGLEVQNKCGNWISMQPLANSLVVNVGRSLESITGGVCTATTHRVNLSAKKFLGADGRALGPRYSFPVFQTLKMDLTSKELASLRIPDNIRDLVDGQQVASDAERYFEKYHLESPGVGIFTARITSHPEVGQKWYPDITERILKGQAEFGTVW